MREANVASPSTLVMNFKALWFPTLHAIKVQCILLVIVCGQVSCPTSPALDDFFSELDNNKDGAIDATEATQFIEGSIGGLDFDEPQEVADAAAFFLRTIDGGDAGLTVSVEELEVHLHAVLSGVRVWDWIRYGVGLPQYSDAFRQHSITPLDFPVLVQQHGRVLERELGVASFLHREKIVKAIRRQMLALGRPPSEPRSLSCSPLPTGPPGRVAVRWQPPREAGTPPLYRFVLEVTAEDGQWRVAAEVDDPEPAAVVVSWVEAGKLGHPGQQAAAAGATGSPMNLSYRVSAWNLYGRSSYGMGVCELAAGQPERSATLHGWWSSLLLVVVPWMLRLMPLPVLRDLSSAVDGLLERAARALGRLLPAWLAGATAGPFGASGLWEEGGPLRQQTQTSLSALGAAPSTGAHSKADVASASPTIPATAVGVSSATKPYDVLCRMRHSGQVGGSGTSSPAAQPTSLPPLPPSSQRPARPPGEGSTSGGRVSAGGGGGGSVLAGGSAHQRSGSEGDMTSLTHLGAGAGAYGGPLQHPAYNSHHNRLTHHHHSALLRNPLVGSAPALGILAAAAAAAAGTAGGADTGFSDPPSGGLSLVRGGSVPGSCSGAEGGDWGWSDAELAQAEAVAAVIAAGKMCAEPGCRRKLDLLHYRDYLRRHYCGRCQKYVCAAHTAFSPHGEKGSCDHVSSCVCSSCFAQYPPERQRALQRLNKMPQPNSPSAGPSPVMVAAGGQAQDVGLVPGLQAGGKRSAKAMWERAGLKLKAVTRFRGKHGLAPREPLEPLVE